MCEHALQRVLRCTQNRAGQKFISAILIKTKQRGTIS